MTKFATCLTTVVIMLASFAFLHATQARGRAGGEDSDEHVSKSEPAPLRGSLGVGQGEDYYFVTLSDIERENGIYAHYNYIYNKHKNNYLTIKWEDAELECFDLVPEGHTRGLYQTRSPEFIEKSSTVLYGSKLDHKKAVPFYAIQKAEKKNARADGADAGIVANANEEATLSSSIDTRTVYGQITLHIVSTLSPTSLVLKLANPGERPIVVSPKTSVI